MFIYDSLFIVLHITGTVSLRNVVEIHTGLSCFRELANMLKRLTLEDLDKLTQRYLHSTQTEVARQTMIDALGTAHTSDCYTVLMRRVFLVQSPEAELLMRALFQLVDLSTPAPEVFNFIFVSSCQLLSFENWESRCFQ